MEYILPAIKTDEDDAETESTISPYEESQVKDIFPPLNDQPFAGGDLHSIPSFLYQEESRTAEHCSVGSVGVNIQQTPNLATAKIKELKSPFQTYLSAGGSSTQSPSMASESLADNAITSGKWTSMSPPADLGEDYPRQPVTIEAYSGDESSNMLNFPPTYWMAGQNAHSSVWPSSSQPAAAGNEAFANYQVFHGQSTYPYMTPTSFQFQGGMIAEAPNVNDLGGGPSSVEANAPPPPMQPSSHPNAATNAANIVAIRPAQTLQRLGVKRISQASTKKASTCKKCKRDSGNDRTGESHECKKIPCLFKLAGCTKEFEGKNEWKRHVTTQHIIQVVYDCPECDKDFPRKDLYSSHYCRSHLSEGSKGSSNSKSLPQHIAKGIEETKAKAEAIVDAQSPKVIGCFIVGCKEMFSSSDRWLRCLDHVVGHLERSLGNEGMPCSIAIPSNLVDYLVGLKTLEVSGSSLVLGELSNGERARRNKKKLGKRRTRREAPNATKRPKTTHKS